MLEYFIGNKEWLLSNIDQLKVWSNIIGFNAKIGEKILNPLRDDKHLGSCYLSEINRSIVIIDHADSKTSGYDCVSAYRYLHPYKKWGEVCSDLLNMAQINIPVSSYRAIPGIKKEQSFTPIYRDWLDSDLEWWSKRGVRLDQLERYITLTKPVCGYIHKKENKATEVHFNERCYCYHFGDKIKMYWPDRKKYRFMGNASCNDIWHIKKGYDTLFISKSSKDLLVIENLLPNADITHVQGEITNHPTTDIIFEWEVVYKNIIILMDQDDAGKKGADLLKSKFLYRTPNVIYVPEEYNLKDIDEVFCKFGKVKSKDLLDNLLK